MGRNIEIKARVYNLENWILRAKELADGDPAVFSQDDTFFKCATGRLKLRAFSNNKGELIFYVRPDIVGPKESRYSIVQTSEPDELRELLSAAWGQIGRVRKTRCLFLSGRTRIHLDRVEGLGEFIELEVVLSEGESVEAGIEVARQFMHKLGIALDSLVSSAYIDLLSNQPPSS